MNPTEPLQDSGLQNGDRITAVAQKPKVVATGGTMALWCDGGDRIVTWGKDVGTLAVQDQIRNVLQIHATRSIRPAFAAILANGRVVTWVSPGHWFHWDPDGDSTRVMERTELLLHFLQGERS